MSGDLHCKQGGNMFLMFALICNSSTPFLFYLVEKKLSQPSLLLVFENGSNTELD